MTAKCKDMVFLNTRRLLTTLKTSNKKSSKHLFIGHCFGMCSFTLYIKFESNDKSFAYKNIELSESNTQQNGKILSTIHLAGVWSKMFEICIVFVLYPF